MAKHWLSKRYGLSTDELLDAIGSRFRLRVAVEGAVSEFHMQKHIESLVGTVIERYESHDLDGQPDFSIWLPGWKTPLRAECKNIRESSKEGGEAYRLKGQIVAYKVETQKTRASKGDPSSRFYDIRHFEMLGVGLGKKTGDWSDFMFANVADLTRNATYPTKLAVFQRVPLPGSKSEHPWYPTLAELLSSYREPR
jgi:hypothetical protein